MIIGNLQCADGFSKMEASLAKYMLEHAEEVVTMNIRDLAKVSFSSTSTITRLCRKIGAKGFADFKVKLSGELSSKDQLNYLVDVNVPFDDGDSLAKIADRIAKISIDSIRETQKAFQYTRMKNIINCILKSETIDIYGEGDSLFASYEFKNKMMRIRKKVRIEAGYAEQVYQAINSTKDNCAIIISHSGENGRVVKVANILKRQRVPIILLTSEGNSTLCQAASYIVHTGTKEKRNLSAKLTTYGSQTAVHYILDCIFSFVYARDYQKNLNTAIQSEKIFTSYI